MVRAEGYLPECCIGAVNQGGEGAKATTGGHVYAVKFNGADYAVLDWLMHWGCPFD